MGRLFELPSYGLESITGGNYVIKLIIKVKFCTKQKHLENPVEFFV